jgi:hypothetical protein
MNITPKLVPVPVACQRAGIGRTTLYAWIGDGCVTARKAGKRTLIDVASLDAHIDALPTVQEAELRRIAAATRTTRN